MKRISVLVLAGLAGSSTASAQVVYVGDSGAPWLAYMNVFELPSNGGGFVFGSPWGRNDLNSSFNDAGHELTLSPNTIGDPNPFWYIGGGGPGAHGNKIMEANLYMETTGVFVGQNLTFQGSVLTNSFTAAHQARVFIRDFAADYSSSVDSFALLAPGAFSISLATIADASRHVQYGFQVKGPDVWFTDTAPFGSLVITTVPTPGSLGFLALSGLMAARRRRV